MRQEIMRLEDISKEMSHTEVLKHIHFDLYVGETVAIMGANGAGKTMLLELLAGISSYDSGKLYFNRELVELRKPKDAHSLGIQYIPIQEGYIDILTVFENLHFDNDGYFFVDLFKQKSEAEKELKKFGLNLKLNFKYNNLDRGNKKLIKIAAAIHKHPKILMLDEPMAFLNDEQQKNLINILNDLRKKGTSILFTTHNLKIAKQLADRGIILREGEIAGVFPIDQYDEKELMAMITGDLYKWQRFSEKGLKKKIALQVEELSGVGIKNISFKLYEGEILGMIGVAGAGRTRVMDLLFGLRKIEKGKIFIDGKEIFITSPQDALRYSIAYVTNKAGQTSTIDVLSVKENIVLPSMKRVSYVGCISNKLSDYIARHYFDIVMNGIYNEDEKDKFKNNLLSKPFGALSLGYQQLIRIAQGLSTSPKILMLDNPTRGLDIKMKKNIHHLLEMLSRKGLSILIISDENDEIFSVCQRYIILNEGKLTGDISKREIEKAELGLVIQNEVDR